MKLTYQEAFEETRELLELDHTYTQNRKKAIELVCDIRELKATYEHMPELWTPIGELMDAFFIIEKDVTIALKKRNVLSKC